MSEDEVNAGSSLRTSARGLRAKVATLSVLVVVSCGEGSAIDAPTTGGIGATTMSGGASPGAGSTASSGSGGVQAGGSGSNPSGGASQGGGGTTGGAPAAGGAPPGTGADGSGGGSSGVGGWEFGTGGMGGALGEVGQTVGGDNCAFTVHAELSSAIGTVGIVRHVADFVDVTAAEIEFGRVSLPWEMTAPVNLARPDARTLLLGMKADSTYRFRIVLRSDSGSCTSPEFTLTTEPLPSFVAQPNKKVAEPGGSRGFFVTTSGLTLSGAQPELASAFIFDSDGDVVWWTPEAIRNTSAARLSWDGSTMWLVNAYGGLWRVSMDGRSSEEFAELRGANHDLAVLPHGGIATMVEGDPPASPPSLVELRPDGSVTTIADLSELYQAESYHPNAIHYYPEDDSFTLSDYVGNGFVKLKRSGELVWQFGGKEPALGNFFELDGFDLWEDNHGHHLTPDGRFLFFNNEETGSASNLIEVELSESTWKAHQTWEHNSEHASPFLGDTQRLPNGNILGVYSVRGLIEEITPEGEVLQQFDMAGTEGPSLDMPSFGYANFRPTLYGPPPR